MRLLSLLVVVGLVNEAHCVLRLHAAKRQIPNAEAIRKEVEETQKKVDAAAKDLADKVEKGPASEAPKKDEGKKDPKKKMKEMDGIEQMKAMLCWGRDHLIDHSDCMKWLVNICQKESSGQGYCKKTKTYVKSKCKKGTKKACDYAKQLGIDVATDKEKIDPDDEDGDGVKDKDDAFPDNPNESKDSDGDGVGDNADKWPNDPTCSKEGDVCGAPAPAPAMSPAPAPSGLHMDEGIPAPSQGYNELSDKTVAHDDGKTMTSDWRGEWPMSNGDKESSIEAICDKNPDHKWCKLRGSAAARKAYAISHP